MPRTDTVLRVLAVLIGLRALTNIFKPLGAGTGLVFFGYLLSGTANLILAPLVGLCMIYYALLIWRNAATALPIGIAYAVYVTFNVLLFPVLQGWPRGFGPVSYLLFGFTSLSLAWGTVWLLLQRRNAIGLPIERQRRQPL